MGMAADAEADARVGVGRDADAALAAVDDASVVAGELVSIWPRGFSNPLNNLATIHSINSIQLKRRYM